jgi:uncharacterized membrane protein
MAWMALDHTRDFFTNIPFEPGTLSQTNLVLFATRWVTHFCAPMFFFLAGTGAFLYGQRKSPSELHHFLWLMWLTVVVILYFPCRWFAVLKQRRKDWWLSYL